ncbi:MULTISPECIES: PucR family transcriptional regulator [Mumia]|nr:MULTISPECIES: PucR family transcriptional regulator ligand-binding domain-containing protein [Mumia]
MSMSPTPPWDAYDVPLAWLLDQEELALRLVEPALPPLVEAPLPPLVEAPLPPLAEPALPPLVERAQRVETPSPPLPPLVERAQRVETPSPPHPTSVAIRWAHSIEILDPTPFLRGGELVLTTGLRMPRARAEQAAYVDRLAAAGVVGLAFGVGVRFETIPVGLRQACRRVGMPLVEVPLPTPFVAITQAVAARQAELQNAVTRRAFAFQQQMTRAALEGGTAGLTAALARELGAGVVVLDEFETTVAVAGADDVLMGRVAIEVESLAARPGPASATVVSGESTLAVQRLGGLERASGWLAVEVPGAISVGDRLLLNQAASLLTLQRERPRELVDARHRLGATVLELLLDTDVVAPAVVRHLGHFGFEPADRVRMVLAAPGHGRTAPLDVVAHALDAESVAHVEARSGDDVLVLVRDQDAHASVEAVVDALARASRHDVVVGVSGALPTARAAAGRSGATHAAASARASHERVGWYGTLTLEAILADDAVRARVAALAESPLAPLLEGSTERDRVLVESLEVFLRHNGSWETASRALGVHRHTLRNRMARVEELTGARLDVAEDRVALLLGLLAR